MEKIKDKIIGILRWSEKYTKTDMLYLARGGSWLSLGQAVSTLAAFATSIAFANLLPPETFGIYKYVLSIYSIIIVTTLSGMNSAVSQSSARGFEGSLSDGVKAKMKWGILGTLSSLAVALYYYFQGNTELALIFTVASIFIPFSESFELYSSLLWGKKLFGVQTKYNIIKKIIYLSAIVATLFLTDNVLIILSVYFAVITLSAWLFLRGTYKKHLSNNEKDPGTVAYGKHLSLINAAWMVFGELDKILIFHYLGAVNLAVYVLAVAPNDQIKGLLKNVNALAMPQFSNRTPEEIKKTIWHKVKVLLLSTGAIV